jgi:NADH-quinone oxidoreductase subunit C
MTQDSVGEPTPSLAPSTASSDLRNAIESRIRDARLDWSVFRDQQRLVVSHNHLLAVMRELRAFGMDQLVDVTAVDLLEYPNATDRFEVVYLLLNTDSGERLIIKTHVNEPKLTLPSMVPIWFGADWLEREVYDMFGIRFEGHPNMKRLLLPEEFESFPLRKDYPIKGRGERHNFPIITRAES